MSEHRFFASLGDLSAAIKRIGPLAFFVALCGCGDGGGIHISVQAPTLPVLNPINAALTEVDLRTADGTLIGSGKVQGSGSFSLGALPINTLPEDMNLSLVSGQDLEGLSRIFSVSIARGATHDYTAAVRKPLIFVGSAAPDEFPAGLPIGGEILDSTTSRDLAAIGTTGVQLPSGTGATATTADGRFLIVGVAGPTAQLSVIDTGNWNTVGSRDVAGAPLRIAVGPRNSAVVALYADQSQNSGSVDIFPDVNALTTAPASAQAVTIPIANDWPRSVAISPDGAHIYVLTGGNAGQQPCTTASGNGGPMLAPNTVMVFNAQGQPEATWTLDAFAADIATDSSGRIILSQSQKDQVSTLPEGTPTGNVSPAMLFRVGCPSAVRVNGTQIYMVSGARLPTDNTSNEIAIGDATNGAAPRTISFTSPTFNRFIGFSLEESGSDTTITLNVLPTSVYAYDMAISPDGNQVLFALRGSYRYSTPQELVGYGLDANGDPTRFCIMTLNAVTYSLYTVDTRASTVRDVSRSDLIVNGAQGNCELKCGYDSSGNQVDQGGQFGGNCAEDSTPMGTEKPIGLTAMFGGF